MNKLIKKFAKTFNIRIFDGTDYNTQTTTSSGLTAEMKTYYSKYLISLVEPQLVHDQFAQKKDIPQGGGKTIEFRKYDSLAKALAPLVEGVTPKGNKMDVSIITSEVHQYGDYITISDILKLAAIDNNIVQATKLLGSQAGRTLDTVTREVIAGGTSVLFAPNVATPTTAVAGRHLLTSANKLTPDVVFQAATILSAANAVPINNQNYVGIIHPYVAYDLMRSPEWISVKEYDNKDYYNGEIGSIGNVRFVTSTEAKIFRGDDLAPTDNPATTSRTLTVNGAVSASADYITFDGGTVVADALIGRQIIVDGKLYNVTDNDASKIYVKETLPAIADDTVIYPGEGGAGGCAVFGVTIVGENAYATTSIEGGGLEHIFKPLGSAGAADPLNQRCSIGWKAIKTAEILVDQYMVRVECGSKYSDEALAN